MRGKWITTANRPNKTGLYSFRKILNIPSKADMTISVCADTSYQLYINDKFVVMGPCRGAGTYYYETKNVSEYIRHGENFIRIEVLHIADDFYTTALAKDRPALWFYGEIKNGDKISEVYADKDWEIWEDNSVRFYIPKVLNSMPPFEERYYEKKYINRQAEVLYECELDLSRIHT